MPLGDSQNRVQIPTQKETMITQLPLQTAIIKQLNTENVGMLDGLLAIKD